MTRDTIQRAILRGAGIALVLGSAVLAAVDPPPQSRVDEIAAMLDARASGLGRPCSDRQAWDGVARRKAFQAVVDAAERLLDDPLPEQTGELHLDYSRTGNRRPWERVASARRGRIRTLVVAECVENDGRFVPAFEQLVRALCAEPTWVYPAHDSELGNFRGERIDIDLGSSYVAGELALARYLLGDKLKNETRALIDAKVRARILDPFRDMALGRREPNWWLECTNNWNSVCLAGVSAAALSLVEDRRERAFYIAAAEQYSKNYLRGFTADGYCSEGLGYWNYGFGRYAVLAEAITRATNGGLDLMSVDAARLPAQFGSRVEIIGGVYPTFADCPMNTKPDRTIVAYVNRHLKRGESAGEDHQADPRRGSLAQTLAFTDWDGAPRSARNPRTSTDPGVRTWFDEAGVLICRPAGGKPGRLGVAIKGGHNAEHHNHNDVGSFIVVAGDRPVLADPGTEVYTARTFSSRRYESKVLNSFGHPVPVVAGALQRCGADARGRVLKADFTDTRDTLVLDLRAAYAAEGLQRLEREFTFERGDVERLVVTDTVEFAQPASFETALVTFGTWRQVTPRLLRVDDEGRAVDVELVTEGLEVAVTAEQIDEDVRTKRKPTRIAIRFVQPVRAARLAMRISPVVAAAHP